VLQIQAGEKVYQDYSLDASDPGGHSARPTKNNPIVRLSAALARLGAYNFPVSVTQTTRAYFEAEARLMSPDIAADMRGVLKSPPDEAAVERLWAMNPSWNATLRTTCVVTQISGGHAVNALPQSARANVNCRALPGVPPAREQASVTWRGATKTDFPWGQLARNYAAGQIIPPHFHDRHQLGYACRGVMTIRTGGGSWIVPTYRAVWIPAGIKHTITMSGIVAMRTLYIRRRLARSLPQACCVASVSPLLKELILSACAHSALRKTKRTHSHLIAVIIDQLRTMQLEPLHLPTPSDPRALRVAQILLSDPGNRQPLKDLCKQAGASKRTVERLFQEEFGTTCGRWRQQLRLMQAMRLLAEGARVSHAALESGYSSSSAFISMFRKSLGTTPILYTRQNARNAGDPVPVLPLRQPKRRG
jgi:AraC-like DNA-binding protein